MPRILIRPHSQPGHLHPTFGLASALAARGHEVVYRVHADLQPEVERRGFASVPVHPEIFPRGWTDAYGALDAPRRGREVVATFARSHEAWMLGDELEVLANLRPDALLADVFCRDEALAGHRLGIPTFCLDTFLARRITTAAPPITQLLAPSASPLELAASAHVHTCLEDGYERRIASLHHATVRFGYPPRGLSFAAACVPALTELPEIVLAPQALRLAGEHRPDVLHFTPPVDDARDEHVPDELARFAQGDGVLVYASLGSQSYRYAAAARIFGAIVEVLRRRPAWRAILAVGPGLASDPRYAPAELPANVRVLSHAPQLWSLERATVFVTHGGANGVREAIERVTPMLVIPLSHDQPGNAIRIEHHGLGVVLPSPLVRSWTMARALEQLVEEHARFQAAAISTRSEVRAGTQNTAVIDAIEHAIATTPPRAAFHVPTRATAPLARGWMFVDDAGPRRDSDGAYHVALGLGDALAYGAGTRVARVEVSDTIETHPAFVRCRELAVLWTLEVGPVLEAFAWACAERAFADEPDAADLRRVFDEARAAGPGTPEVEELVTWLSGAGRRWWERGYEPAMSALVEPPLDAATSARRQAIGHLATRAAGALAGTREGALIFERAAGEQRLALDALLHAAIVGHAAVQLGSHVVDADVGAVDPIAAADHLRDPGR